MELLAHINLNSDDTRRDLVTCKPSDEGEFTTKSAYNLAYKFEEVNDHFNWKLLWKFKGPMRASLFLWFASKGALTTRELLYARGIGDTDTCPICHQRAETIIHVLRDCVWNREVWTHLLPQFYSLTEYPSWIARILHKEYGRDSQHGEWKHVFRETVYMIWYRRKNMIFGNKGVVTAPDVFVKLIREKVDELLDAPICCN